jgi:hypothetical protein
MASIIHIKQVGFPEEYLQSIYDVFMNQIFRGCLVRSIEPLKSNVRLINVIDANLPKPFVLGLCSTFRNRWYNIGLFFAPFLGFCPPLDATSALGRLSLNGGFSFSSNQFPLKREAEGGRPSASENLRFWETQHSINDVKFKQKWGKRQPLNCLP